VRAIYFVPSVEEASRFYAALVLDQEWGRTLCVRGPGGDLVQIDEQDQSLYT
jgi:hypothetical protein